MGKHKIRQVPPLFFNNSQDRIELLSTPGLFTILSIPMSATPSSNPIQTPIFISSASSPISDSAFLNHSEQHRHKVCYPQASLQISCLISHPSCLPVILDNHTTRSKSGGGGGIPNPRVLLLDFWEEEYPPKRFSRGQSTAPLRVVHPCLRFQH
jgi:hypothetical protein